LTGAFDTLQLGVLKRRLLLDQCYTTELIPVKV